MKLQQKKQKDTAIDMKNLITNSAMQSDIQTILNLIALACSVNPEKKNQD